jgi:hypothetical protein
MLIAVIRMKVFFCPLFFHSFDVGACVVVVIDLPGVVFLICLCRCLSFQLHRQKARDLGSNAVPMLN